MNMEMETSSVKLTNICRICLQNVHQSTSLFGEVMESKEILNKIYSCFQIIITYEKHLPSVICDKCLQDLNIASGFRERCLSFEERFLSLIEDLNGKNDFVHEQYEQYEEINSNEDLLNKKILNTHKNDFNTDLSKNIIISEQNPPHKKDIFLCSVCKKVLKTEVSLNKHMISMHQKRKHLGKVTGFGPDRRYHCIKCSYSTPHSQTLINHMRRHNGDRPYSCECGKSFTQSSSLTAHRKTHSDTTYFTCSLCGKQFKHASSLKNHLNVHESGKFSCDVCHKNLKSRQSLQDHMFRHYNIRNYNCEDCGDTFVTCSELLNHKKKHSSLKKVECHLCGYKTHTKKNLIIHLKRHTGDKSFKCNICQMAFYSNGDLQRHKRVHTREKPFPCPTCTQRFTHSTSLNKHMNTVHGVIYKWADFKCKDVKKAKI